MYVYKEQRPFVFTEEGPVKFLKIRDTCQALLGQAGAFRLQEAWNRSGVSGDSWETSSTA